MSRLDELAARAGAAVQDDARRRAGQAPPITVVRRRRMQRRAGFVGGVACVAVGAAVIAGSGVVGVPQLLVDDPLGTPRDPSETPVDPSEPGPEASQPPPTADVELSAALLPGGWTVAQLPIEAAGRTVIAPSAGALAVFVATGAQGDHAGDLLVGSAAGWVVHAGVIEHRPEVLATTTADGGWVLAVDAEAASLFTAEGRAATIEPPPAALSSGVTGAAWRTGRFVVVGRATGPYEPTPAFALDPQTGVWQPLQGAPLAVNRGWNSSLVAAGGHVYLLDAWLDSSNQPARTTLGAARLDTDGTWTLVDGGALSPQSADAVTVDDRVLAVDYTGEAAVFDRQAGTWTRIAPPTPREDHTMRRPVATFGGFLVPTVRPTNSGAAANEVFALEPARAWPLEPGVQGVIARPPGWTVATEPLVNEPADQTLIRVSTAAMPAGGADGCEGLPAAAVGSLGATDALVIIRASDDGATDTQPLGALTDLGTAQGELAPGCTADGITTYRTHLRSGPDTLAVIVAHGPNAPDTILDEARAIANSCSPR